MKRTLIVSDLHLDPSLPERYEAALSAITRVDYDALILAGDIFEAWIGADGADPLDEALLKELGHGSEKTVFIPGNRDFLLDSTYLSQFKIQTAPRVLLENILIIHGDELCTSDHDYQRFRAEVRTEQWRTSFLTKSLKERQVIANDLRQASRKNQMNRADAIGDVVELTVESWMEDFEVSLLIHGHTHRPQVHPQKNGLRIVTSDWNLMGIGVLLEVKKESMTASHIRLEAASTEYLDQWETCLGIPEWKRNSSSSDVIK